MSWLVWLSENRVRSLPLVEACMQLYIHPRRSSVQQIQRGSGRWQMVCIDSGLLCEDVNSVLHELAFVSCRAHAVFLAPVEACMLQ